MPAATETMISSYDEEQPTMLLSEWIRRMLNEAANQNRLSAAPVNPLAAQFRDTLILCSDDYLIPALRVAWSLADQICKVEEAAAAAAVDGQQSLPAPSSNWANGIVVHLQPDSWRRRSNNLIGNDCSGLDNKVEDPVQNAKENNVDAETVDDAAAPIQIQDGTSPKGGVSPFAEAELLPSLLQSENCDGFPKSDGSKTTERIYSLGLVFYEIFSGGRRPPEIDPQNVFIKSGDTDTEGEQTQEQLGVF